MKKQTLKSRASHPALLYPSLTVDQAAYLVAPEFNRKQVENIYMYNGQKINCAILMKYTNRDVTFALHSLKTIVDRPEVLKVILEDKRCLKKGDLAGPHRIIQDFISQDDHALIISKLQKRASAKELPQPELFQ